MRKLRLSIIAVAVAGVCIYACKKKDNSPAQAPSPPSNTAQVQTLISGSTTKSGTVTSHDWKVTKIVMGGFDVTGQLFPPCRIDNIYTLKSDFNAIVDEGPTKCNADDPQSQPGKWGLASDGKLFFVKTNDADSIGGTIVSSSNSYITINVDFGGATGNLTFDRIN